LKLPRDESGVSLAKRLEKFGYSVTRQTGSHLRLTTLEKGEHHITIPSHRNIKAGTLHSILVDIAKHLSITKDEVMRKLW